MLTSLTEDVIKFGLKWTLTQAKAVAENVAGVHTETAAHVAGDATMTASDQSAAAAGGFAWIGNALKAIEADAAQAFAGVFAFLAPILGPAAAGPAAAASSTVLAAGGAIASADIGMWGVPKICWRWCITTNSSCRPGLPPRSAPCSRKATAATARAVDLSPCAPTTNIHVHALDGAGVAQWARSNGPELARGMHQAARHGALLGLRQFNR